MTRYIQGSDRSQVTLLPECLDDYICEENPVRVIDVDHPLIHGSLVQPELLTRIRR